MTLREQVVAFLREPERFASGATDQDLWLSALRETVEPLLSAPDQHPLRKAQVAAWEGLANTRVGLVLGPPGTGKTHLLAWLILGYVVACRQAGRPCRVLVSAFTRAAIGNLMDSVAKRVGVHGMTGIDLVYVGAEPAGGLGAGIDRITRTDVRGLNALLGRLQSTHVVVGGSVWDIYKLLRSGTFPGAQDVFAPVFDLICIDEASQMPLGHGLIALGALVPDGRIVVAGDDKQLPPIRVARKVVIENRNLGGSLYAFLKSAGTSEFALDETFRLNRPLTLFPEKRFYKGKFRSVAEDRRLDLRTGWEADLPEWQRVALDPEWPICVVVHEGPSAATRSPFEASVVASLSAALRERLVGDGGVVPCPPEEYWRERMAVISPHRAQNRAIIAALHASNETPFVETVDRIQGKERDCVILSYCVSDPEFALAEAEFIYSPERLNVATTRARSKLIVLVSRQLLEAVPNDQDVLDQVQVLREFVFSCGFKGTVRLPDGGGGFVGSEIRVRGFTDVPILADLAIDEVAAPVVGMDARLEGVLEAVGYLSLRNRYNNASLDAVRNRLARDRQSVLQDLVALHRLGRISLVRRTGQNDPWWSATPLEEPRKVFEPTDADLLLRIEEAIAGARHGRSAPFYDKIRDRFAWMDGAGDDVLFAHVQDLGRAGALVLQPRGTGITVDMAEQRRRAVETDHPALPKIDDEDFAVLNDLEDIEADRINHGVFEGWVSPQGLADRTGRARVIVTRAVGRLAAHGYLMIAEDQRVRSRMAETARSMRYVKQRFDKTDAARRPYLVRSLKVELRNRNKPSRDVDLGLTIASLRQRFDAEPAMQEALGGLLAMLTSLWGERPMIAGFQDRAMTSIFERWFGEGGSLVVSADTGSGKTEAACLPMMAAAAADRIAGLDGTRAVIAYPRVRLAANQAQRLARYLSALADVPGMPLLTLGLQVGAVPFDLRRIGEDDAKRGWTTVGAGMLDFPFFGCPTCEAPLILQIEGGSGSADRLDCLACGWRYDGWVGSKRGMIARPPTFFLPTTDSLHQWLHDPRYGSIFGDTPDFAAPRAVLADEIHLYSHIHGAQVAQALRRLVHRLKTNTRGVEPLALGMSATLGSPAMAWGRLLGRADVVEVRPEPHESDVNPRGREYFIFVQPEVESRGRDIAGTSTTIQAVMCLAHGMRRRTGREGGYRSIVFLDSIDKLRRMHSAFADAEEQLKLAALRTRMYPDDPMTGQPRQACCGQPYGCDLFQDGECWHFAATDERQQTAHGIFEPGSPLHVVEQPISSASEGRVDALIKNSDIVFSTSSLEVGFDDPDITMVYQHYAPQNLASFIQRKGRGGRGIDDRPVTGVTLSLYSPRDTWWFSRPKSMIEPTGYDVPINPENHFVVRGHVLAALLDGLASHQARTGSEALGHDAVPDPDAWRSAVAYAEDLFGSDIATIVGETSIERLWLRAAGRMQGGETLPDIRRAMPWVPDLLFDTINLPKLDVVVDARAGRQIVSEDILLGLGATTPGNVTRRFHPQEAHWTEPKNGRQPWLTAEDYERAKHWPYAAGSEALRGELPLEAQARIGADLLPKICRPVQITLSKLGFFIGATWETRTICEMTPDGPGIRQSEQISDRGRRISHESRGELRGFPVIAADAAKANVSMLSAKPIWLRQQTVYLGNGLGRADSGLAVLRLYWGADSEIRMEDRAVDPVSYSQTFTAPASDATLLHGFHVITEGVRFHLDIGHLDAFVRREQERLAAAPTEQRWHMNQWMRYLVEAKARGAGVNAYDAQRGAELLTAAAGDPQLRSRLNSLLLFWDDVELAELFEDTRSKILGHHPLLSMARVKRTAESLGDARFKDVFKEVVAEMRSDAAFAEYLRSLVLHGMTQRLKLCFLIVGGGDERRTVGHVKLPIQFGGRIAPDASDVITIAELGHLGDGTTRAFNANLSEVEAMWSSGFLDDCAAADEDSAIERFFSLPERHTDWRSRDPNSRSDLQSIAEELGLGQTPLPSTLIRVLFEQVETPDGDISLYNLALEIDGVSRAIASRSGRESTIWETTSAAVRLAQEDGNGALGRLLETYRGIEKASLDDSLSPEARLADQVHRIAARQCVDGCRACLHQGSDIMGGSLVPSSVSRRVLSRFLSKADGNMGHVSA